MKQEQLAKSGRGQSPSAAETPTRPDPTLGMVPAYFTENELRALMGVCRDSDNENAGRILKAALARGGKS